MTSALQAIIYVGIDELQAAVIFAPPSVLAVHVDTHLDIIRGELLEGNLENPECRLRSLAISLRLIR